MLCDPDKSVPGRAPRVGSWNPKLSGLCENSALSSVYNKRTKVASDRTEFMTVIVEGIKSETRLRSCYVEGENKANILRGSFNHIWNCEFISSRILSPVLHVP